ncbi:hypothetical protein [Flavobacterium aquatile]|uniref:Uncharacterized protein n=1 Tax=Flavobacterium aquatile LMG 4008 = ATCC 11947 TaxID=1453498 RepID=A0A095UX57_9FLAO|nr:hypothetical protein [Flavobacterium aquatile]KGD67125.1 hypothetical protein LG45_12930 [Flavobacterium aquatile LMG 4008 = ATCC 11947]OXA66717.1 hypothetical protein B0A61_10970 [Flavobacterium aquatile LMG 4008 = ATCC 11947]GEC78421.1 hypothetical protein FAQ01_12910 [Flavobacterium aquatile]
MKKLTALVILVSFLLQSCFSYKTIDKELTSKKIGKIHKVKLGNKYYKGRLISFNDSISTFKIGKSEMNIKNSEIDKLKVREFSVVQTIVFTSAMLLTVLVVSYIANPKINVPLSPTSPN